MKIPVISRLGRRPCDLDLIYPIAEKRDNKKGHPQAAALIGCPLLIYAKL
ncbi:hypothetical protein GNF98_16875 [Clostridium perfringens]